MNQQDYEIYARKREEAWTNMAGAGLGASTTLGPQYGQQTFPNIAAENDRVLREKALHMAIDFHCSHGDVDGVEATAAKFLAFLKGGADV